MMPAIRQQLQRSSNWFNDRPMVLRGLGLLVVMVVVYWLWNVCIHASLAKKIVEQDKQLVQLRQQVSLYQIQVGDIEQRLRDDPSLRANRQLGKKREEVAMLDKQKQVVISDIVTAREVLHMLSSQLKNVEGIELLALDSISSAPLMEAHEELETPNEYAKLDKNAILLKFKADYFGTLRYLQALEKSGLRIFWDNLQYDVSGYPLAIVSIKAHFISHQVQ